MSHIKITYEQIKENFSKLPTYEESLQINLQKTSDKNSKDIQEIKKIINTIFSSFCNKNKKFLDDIDELIVNFFNYQIDQDKIHKLINLKSLETMLNSNEAKTYSQVFFN